MNTSFHITRHTILSKIISTCIILCFAFTSMLPPAHAQAILNLPAPGTMVMPSTAYSPAVMLGMTLNPQNPLEIDFIIDRGDDAIDGDELREVSQKLLSYFYATMTVPEEEMWVNLSPYEENRIMAEGLGNTVLGRDMLAQDYMLKQLSASMAYPEEEMGRQFWQRVRTKAMDEYGQADIPMNTFNKIWIVPATAKVHVHQNSVFVMENYLKVMLEEDYLALEHNSGQESEGDPMTGLTNEIVREVLIPEIEYEINYGKNFAPLRQMFHSMVLATWYKQNLKSSMLTKLIANQNKTDGINLDDPTVIQNIYDQYVKAFEVGVYDYVKEEMDATTKETLPRKYFSGGVAAEEIHLEDSAMTTAFRRRITDTNSSLVNMSTRADLNSGSDILDEMEEKGAIAPSIETIKRMLARMEQINQSLGQERRQHFFDQAREIIAISELFPVEVVSELSAQKELVESIRRWELLRSVVATLIRGYQSNQKHQLYRELDAILEETSNKSFEQVQTLFQSADYQALPDPRVYDEKNVYVSTRDIFYRVVDPAYNYSEGKLVAKYTNQAEEMLNRPVRSYRGNEILKTYLNLVTLSRFTEYNPMALGIWGTIWDLKYHIELEYDSVGARKGAKGENQKVFRGLGYKPDRAMISSDAAMATITFEQLPGYSIAYERNEEYAGYNITFKRSDGSLVKVWSHLDIVGQLIERIEKEPDETQKRSVFDILAKADQYQKYEIIYSSLSNTDYSGFTANIDQIILVGGKASSAFLSNPEDGVQKEYSIVVRYSDSSNIEQNSVVSINVPESFNVDNKQLGQVFVNDLKQRLVAPVNSEAGESIKENVERILSTFYKNVFLRGIVDGQTNIEGIANNAGILLGNQEPIYRPFMDQVIESAKKLPDNFLISILQFSRNSEIKITVRNKEESQLAEFLSSVGSSYISLSDVTSSELSFNLASDVWSILLAAVSLDTSGSLTWKEVRFLEVEEGLLTDEAMDAGDLNVLNADGKLDMNHFHELAGEYADSLRGLLGELKDKTDALRQDQGNEEKQRALQQFITDSLPDDLPIFLEKGFNQQDPEHVILGSTLQHYFNNRMFAAFGNVDLTVFLGDATPEQIPERLNTVYEIIERLEAFLTGLENLESLDGWTFGRSDQGQPTTAVSIEYVLDKDAAMTSYGGIDFNANNLDLRGQGEPIQFQFPALDISPNAVQGVSPVILKITPIVNLPLLLGLTREDEFEQLSRLD